MGTMRTILGCALIALVLVGCDGSPDAAGGDANLRGMSELGGADGAAAGGTGGGWITGGTGGRSGSGVGGFVATGVGGFIATGAGGEAASGAGGFIAGAGGFVGGNGAGGFQPTPSYPSCGADPGVANGCRRSSPDLANGTPWLYGYKDGMQCVLTVNAQTGLPGPSGCTISSASGAVLSVASCDECIFR